MTNYPVKKQQAQAQSAEGIFTAIVADPGTADATIILPGTTAPTQKRYKYALTGQQLSAGDRVYVIPISGTYVLLGGAVAGGGGGSLPPGGAIYDALVKRSAASGDVMWSTLLYRGEDGGLCEVDEI